MIDQKLNTASTNTLRKPISMTNLDLGKKTINLSDVGDGDDDDETSPPPAKQVKMSKGIKKTTSVDSKLSTNSTQPTTISALLGIVDSPVKTNLTPQQPVQILKPGSFYITLCIDNAEASRSTQKVLLDHLTKNSIKYDVRKLNIGDYLWTVRRKSSIFFSNFRLIFFLFSSQ